MIASCSTLPSRVENKNFKETVMQLCNHPNFDAVFIHYPKYCKRLNQDYPPVPTWMQNHSKIVINQKAEDCGPLTKMAPLLDLFPPKVDMGVFLFDDDRLYSLQWIDELLEAFERHGRTCCVARQGTLARFTPFKYNHFNFSQSDQEYVCVKTASGVIYPFKAFPKSFADAIHFANKYKDNASYRNDDMLLASWCYQTKTSLFIIPVTSEQMKHWYKYNDDVLNDTDSLSRIPDHKKPQIDLAKAMMLNGDWPLPFPEIIVAIILVIVLVVLIASPFMVYKFHGF